MRIAYCPICKPPVIVAVIPTAVYAHRTGAERHEAKVIEVEDETLKPGESAAAYLARLAEKYKEKLT